MPLRNEKADRKKIEVFKSAKSSMEVQTRLNIPETAIRKLRQRLEKQYKIKLPRYMAAAGREFHSGENPFSENVAEFKENWTADDCIRRLLKIVKENPDKVISRNYFRVNSGISEATWNRYFGTWHEFKRQSGVVLSRHQHTLEQQIARHASVDHYRALNALKADWGDKYNRPVDARFQTGIVIGDLHDKNVDPFYLEVLLDTIKRVQPDWININGDLFDLPEFGKYFVDPREWDVVGRINFVHEQILKPIRELVPDAQIDLNEGNHEFRLLRHLGDATPAMKVLLSELHGFSVSRLLGLDKYEVNYISVSDLTAKTVADIKKEIGKNYSVYHNCFISHHYPYGVRYGMPGCNGHHHKHIVTPLYSEVFGSYEWHQVGCGHIRAADFTAGQIWSNGFDLIHVDTHRKFVNHEYITIGETMAIVGGKYYIRGIDDG